MTQERKQKLTLYAAILIVIIAASAFLNRRYVQIDACLDAGNAWDYANSICSDTCADKGRVFDVETSTCLMESAK